MSWVDWYNRYEQTLDRFHLRRSRRLLELGVTWLVAFLLLWLILPWQGAIVAVLVSTLFLAPIFHQIRVLIERRAIERSAPTPAFPPSASPAPPRPADAPKEATLPPEMIEGELPRADYPLLPPMVQ